MHNRRISEAAIRAQERRRREDESSRLADEVPKLESLRLEIEERRGGSLVAAGQHIRRIVVESAPALFALSCGDKSCKDGGHELTREIIGQLKAGATRFEGEDECHGQLGTVRCSTMLRYVAIATYRP